MLFSTNNSRNINEKILEKIFRIRNKNKVEFSCAQQEEEKLLVTQAQHNASLNALRRHRVRS